MSKSLNLAALRAFCEVADCLSFTQAAQNLYRSQPALSRQVAELESLLGVRLFDREAHHLALTAAGHDLRQRALAVLREAEGFSARAQAFASGALTSIRVGGNNFSLESVVPRILVSYRARWPTVSVNCFEFTTAELRRRLEIGDLDFIISRFVSSRMLAGERLFPMFLVVVVEPQHAWGSARQIEVSALADEPLLVKPPDAGSRILLERACRQAQTRPSRIKVESNSDGALIELALAGHGVAVLQSTVSASRPQLRVIPVVRNGLPISEWAGIMWHSEATLPPFAKAFVRTASAVARKDFPTALPHVDAAG